MNEYFKKNGYQLMTYTLVGLFIIYSPFLMELVFQFDNSNADWFTKQLSLKHYSILAINMLLLSFIVHVPLAFFSKTGKLLYFFLLLLLVYFPSILDFAHVVVFKCKANSSSLYTLFESNKNEALSFITNYSTAFNALMLYLFFVLVFFLYFFLLTWQKRKFAIFASLLFHLCIAFTGLVFVKKTDWRFVKQNSSINLLVAYQDFRSNVHQFQLHSKKNSTLKVSFSDAGLEETHVVVIGESTSKYHLSLYHYERNTNPNLGKIKNELMVFDHVLSPHVHTISSLKEIFVQRDNSGIHYDLIDLFNHSGYKTFWLSNQPYMGENQNFVSVLSTKTSKQIFTNPQGNQVFDEELLPQLQKILKDKARKKVIFVHLMGTHLSYEDRYPSCFSTFKEKNISVFGKQADNYINYYDNAVRYNDYVLFNMIKELKKNKGKASMVYFSDHGDEVYDFRDFHGHHEGLLSKYMNSVPLIFWRNCKEKHNDFNLVKAYNLKNLSHSLQDFYNIKAPNYDSSKSVFKAQLQLPVKKNSVKFKNAKPFQKLFWVHRVNSIDRLNEVQHLFKGMEMDVVFDNGKLDVRHPPTTSINLSLDLFLSNVNNVKSHYYWLDLKNLRNQNYNSIILYLNEIDRKYGIKGRLIVETPEIELIPHFSKAGYMTSYYLPEAAMKKNQEAISLFEKAVRLTNIYHPTFVSQSLQHHRLMMEYFANYPQLIWALQADWSMADEQKRIRDYVYKNPNIAVCLVNFNSKSWR